MAECHLPAKDRVDGKQLVPWPVLAARFMEPMEPTVAVIHEELLVFLGRQFWGMFAHLHCQPRLQLKEGLTPRRRSYRAEEAVERSHFRGSIRPSNFILQSLPRVIMFRMA